MIAFGRYGEVGGRICYFTNLNPKTNAVWSDDLDGYAPKPGNDKRMTQCKGAWVRKDKVKWLEKGQKV